MNFASKMAILRRLNPGTAYVSAFDHMALSASGFFGRFTATAERSASDDWTDINTTFTGRAGDQRAFGASAREAVVAALDKAVSVAADSPITEIDDLPTAIEMEAGVRGDEPASALKIVPGRRRGAVRIVRA